MSSCVIIYTYKPSVPDVQVTTVSTCRKSVADSESESVLLNNDAAIDWAIQSNKLHAVH